MTSDPPTPVGIHVTLAALGDYDVCGAVVEGRDRVLVWDTLSCPGDLRGVLPDLAGRELVIVYSHADWDHVWGTAGLPYGDARILAQAHGLARFDDDVPRTLEQKRRDEPGRWDTVVLVPPTETFETACSIDLGGAIVELYHLAGHTPDCLVGFVPERGAWLGGDTVETPLPVVPPDAPLDTWIAGLERWADDPRVRWVLPAHGGAGGPAIIERNLRYLRAIRDGRPLDPGPDLAPFYRATHAANATWRAHGR